MPDEYPVYAKLSTQKTLQLGGDYFDWEDDDSYDDEDTFLVEDKHFDCGFVPGQGCSLAGSEDCDFDCPYRDELMKHPAYPNCDLLASDYSM